MSPTGYRTLGRIDLKDQTVFSKEKEMYRRTKSLSQALERLVPFAEDLGWEIKKVTDGKWLERLTPAKKWLGDIGPFKAPTIKVIGPVVAHIREDHPEAERVREVVRWYGKVPYALHHRHASALEWLKLKEEEL
tara:strand:- start:704 stop:1105 length:402 start_codon:yes stop_codon:yes gene_type:complete